MATDHKNSDDAEEKVQARMNRSTYTPHVIVSGVLLTLLRVCMSHRFPYQTVKDWGPLGKTQPCFGVHAMCWTKDQVPQTQAGSQMGCGCKGIVNAPSLGPAAWPTDAASVSTKRFRIESEDCRAFRAASRTDAGPAPGNLSHEVLSAASDKTSVSAWSGNDTYSKKPPAHEEKR